MSRARRKSRKPEAETARAGPTPLRIIGGRFRGRKLLYSGDDRVRPMKDRVREALFNLVGPAIKGKHAIDLFAGTGALGLEALSRGAGRATFIERHFPTARVIEQNVHALDAESVAQVVASDTFFWVRRLAAAKSGELAELPWAIFCSPPYDYYVERQDEIRQLLATLLDLAPAGSLLAVESDERFDFSLLPRAEDWGVRTYPPAVVGVLRTPSE
jgi:16S rRNA (guanine966-N2)-methyltransferase